MLRCGPRPLWHHTANAQKQAEKLGSDTFFYDYLKGVHKYYASDYNFGKKNYKSIWQKEGVRALVEKDAVDDKNPKILLVPSLINGFEIFDLFEEQSFFSYLNKSGFSAHILDWGMPNIISKKNFEQYVQDFLVPCIKDIKPDFIIGYCMGGLLTAAGLKDRVSVKSNYIFMATPWDFSKMHETTLMMAQNIWDSSKNLKAYMPFVPLDMLQMFFASVDPDNTAQKFVNFLNETDKIKEKRFVAVEDWLNNGLGISWDIYELAMKDWYQNNDISSIRVDDWPEEALIVVPQKDKLVSPLSAKALATKISKSTVLEPDLGHIGLMASSRAEKSVWNDIKAWMNERLK